MTHRRKTAAVALGVAACLVLTAVIVGLLRRPRPPAALLADFRSQGAPRALRIVNPLDETLFPADFASPTFRWSDPTPNVKRWRAVLELARGKKHVSAQIDDCRWKPTPEQWAAIKRDSTEAPGSFIVLGLDGSGREILSGGTIQFSTSADPVGAPIFYRDVPLPFSYAVQAPETIRWRLGDVSSEEAAPVVLQNLPVCGNCHSFSSDGKTLGMDIDYANDKGSYVVAPVEEQTVLDRGRVITWSDYKREDGVPTFGLLSQVSPDGRYVVGTVKDRSIFVPRDDLTFSQLFFPVKGILVVYERQTKTFRSLPGADDPHYVQSNPCWSPDGKYLLFARARAEKVRGAEEIDSVLLPVRLAQDFLEGKRGFQFDLYRIPFNSGEGGEAVPLPGASHNGMSNYFPKLSPDGKWLVFTQAKGFMLLQPDSKLYLLPAEGGTPRLMRCNTSKMNSWHSWSPNGKWLVFSSKVNGPYTQLFLTHIDEQGNDTPALLLENLTLDCRAANIPEFVNLPPGQRMRLIERFVDEYNLSRRADEMARYFGDYERAAEYYAKALTLDPGNVADRLKLAHAYLMLGQPDTAEREHKHALEQSPGNREAQRGLATFYLRTDRVEEAVEQLRSLLKECPGDALAHQELGAALLRLGKTAEAVEHTREAVRLNPALPLAHLYLGLGLEDSGKPEAAAEHFATALACDPAERGTAQCLEVAQRLMGKQTLRVKVADLLRSVLEVDARSAEAHLMLGQLYLDDGMTGASLNCLEAAFELNPQMGWLKPKIDELRRQVAESRGAQ